MIFCIHETFVWQGNTQSIASDPMQRLANDAWLGDSPGPQVLNHTVPYQPGVQVPHNQPQDQRAGFEGTVMEQHIALIAKFSLSRNGPILLTFQRTKAMVKPRMRCFHKLCVEISFLKSGLETPRSGDQMISKFYLIPQLPTWACGHSQPLKVNSALELTGQHPQATNKSLMELGIKALTFWVPKLHFANQKVTCVIFV